MSRFFIGLFFLSLHVSIAHASFVRGKVTDSKTGEALVGSTIFLKEIKMGTITGLDGSFLLKNVPSGQYRIVCSFLSYETAEKTLTVAKETTETINFSLSEKSSEIQEVTVTSKSSKSSEVSARQSERYADQVINVVSAKTIELSPDLTVANVMQRVSGVVLERSSSGEGQYAILRGMDKRFNYSMVNGMKIPSPDNKNRFVPLDIFPSELLDRLEVTKSMTANMEADAIGGTVNMVMKEAPANRQVTANLGSGYNALFFHSDNQSFDAGSIQLKSPSERYGLAYPVQMKDFTLENLHVKSGRALPNLTAGFSMGDRFFNKRLGFIIAGSFQNNFKGNSSDNYSTTTNSLGEQIITHRFFSNQQTRIGLHAKLDYQLGPGHKLMWYNAYLDFRNGQVRDAISYNAQTTRLRWNQQTILTSTLKGTDRMGATGLDLDWSLSYGQALNQTPDNVQINALIINGITSIDQNDGASRKWEHNSDDDWAGYANLTRSLKMGGSWRMDLSTGGMYRDKFRSSFFNEYHFKPYDGAKAHPQEIIKGVDYQNYDEIKFEVNSYGNLSDPLNYEATEKIGAAYVMGKASSDKVQIVSGLRVEHTNQGYHLKFPTDGARNEGNQVYSDVLPSISLKYSIHQEANLRISYAKGINRPSFFEIVPYSMIYEEYKERGNPDLKHTIAHNFDFRYEYFPHPTDQLMVGIFYKRMLHPIEFGMMNGFGQDIYYMPMNFGNASNYGIELDYMRFFSWFGVKANYTFTQSGITTTKIRVKENPDPNSETNIVTEYVNQTRPLFGQAANVANFSLLLKDKHHGWDGQLAFSYTGDRLCIVSRYLDQDSWQAGFLQLDASVEKRLGSGLTFFAKASNLLDSPMIQYVRKNSVNQSYAGVERFKQGIVERKEFYGQNFMIGIRYKLQ
ncbi:MAG: TonB-dependent receptor [Marinilabiliales bacterium]|nr:TonB-dependent receptor [Marinilabiliales bacterium]